MKIFTGALAVLALGASPLMAQNTDPVKAVEDQQERTERVAQQLWDWAELGYLESQSSGLLMEELSSEGFKIETGVAGIPTAFIAEWGEGYQYRSLLGDRDPPLDYRK